MPLPWRHSMSSWMGLWEPDRAVGVHCRWLDWMSFRGPFPLKGYYNSMILLSAITKYIFLWCILWWTHPLNSSRNGDSTNFLGSLFQFLTNLSEKKFFLISNLNLPCFLMSYLLSHWFTPTETIIVCIHLYTAYVTFSLAALLCHLQPPWQAVSFPLWWQLDFMLWQKQWDYSATEHQPSPDSIHPYFSFIVPLELYQLIYPALFRSPWEFMAAERYPICLLYTFTAIEKSSILIVWLWTEGTVVGECCIGDI